MSNSSSKNAKFHCYLSYFGINLTFTPMHFSIVSIKNCNHKSLGIYYLYSSLLFGISGTLCSMILRLELYSSGHRIISSENQNFYNFIFTLHGLLMIA